MHGPATALAAVEELDIPGYHLLPATRADLLARLGRVDEARGAYDEASPWPATTPNGRSCRDRRARLAP